MEYKNLQLIDFSQGIKSSQVMHNDLVLQEQIERERLSIAGYGINYGLNITLQDTFKAKVDTGTLVNNDGKEIMIKGKEFEIEKPKIITRSQRVFSKDNGVITLEEIPYSSDRTAPSQYVNKMYWGIEVYYEDSPMIAIDVTGINGNTIYTGALDTVRPLIVTYNIAYDRVDTIYINKDNNISIVSGISSTTPSTYIPEDFKCILGFIKTSNKVYDEEKDIFTAKTFVIKEFNNRRTVYTDDENNLYLCGIPFESLLKIYFAEPKNPKEGTVWYDMTTNKMKIWRRTDNFVFSDIYTYTSSDPNNKQLFKTSVGYYDTQLNVYVQNFQTQDKVQDIWRKLKKEEIEFYTDLKDSEKGTAESLEFRIIPKLLKGAKVKYTINRYDESYYWVPVNDTSFIQVNECKMWCPNEDNTNLLNFENGLNLNEMTSERENHDLKHFIFNAKDMHLRFTPCKNELSILINQIPLHKDQFVELTVSDILNSDELTNMAILNYGYTIDTLQQIKDECLDVGVGFKFVNVLDEPAFIEVNIQHRVNDSILKNKFQRSATFSKSESIVWSDSHNLTTSEDNRAVAIFDTCVPYRFGEEQIEVYINGLKISKNNILEISTTKMIGSMCKSFGIYADEVSIKYLDVIEYKIVSTIYSYDHVVSAIKDSNAEVFTALEAALRRIEVLEEKIKVIEGV